MTRRLSVDGPHPGNWFAVAFITWTDPNNDRIEQQGKQFRYKDVETMQIFNGNLYQITFPHITKWPETVKLILTVSIFLFFRIGGVNGIKIIFSNDLFTDAFVENSVHVLNNF